MDDSTLFLLLIGNIILSLVVGWAASQRGRGSMGWFFLSLVISPILALIVLMAAGDQKKKDVNPLSIPDYLVWKQQTQAGLVPTPAMQAAGLPRPLLSKWHIARGEDQLGEFSLAQITDSYRAGVLTSSDLYWDTQAHEWLELAAHPRLG
jgi:hypothetical protein